MTGLTRFLGTGQTVHAFGAMEIKELAMPVSMDYPLAAGGIENIATNPPQVVERVNSRSTTASRCWISS